MVPRFKMYPILFPQQFVPKLFTTKFSRQLSVHPYLNLPVPPLIPSYVLVCPSCTAPYPCQSVATSLLFYNVSVSYLYLKRELACKASSLPCVNPIGHIP